MNWVGEKGLLWSVLWEADLYRSRVVWRAKSKSCREGGRNVVRLGFVSRFGLWDWVFS